MREPIIAVTMGDPCGIGPEVVALSLQDRGVWKVCSPVVIGQKDVFDKAIEVTNARIERVDMERKSSDEEVKIIRRARSNIVKHGVIRVPFVSIGNVDINEFRVGAPSKICGRLSFEFVKEAVRMCTCGVADGIATAPINKYALRMAGIKYIGHTEMLKGLTGSKEAITMFQVKGLRIFFLSRHVSLKEAINQVKEGKILEMLKTADRYLRRLKIKAPHIAVAALNPHAGEKGMFGTEEIEEIKPAIERARSIGIMAEGPYPADSVFYRAANGEFDAVLALYHDQGHIASKMYDFYKTISITLGLPFIRTSVDHGTAYDIAGKGMANPTSMKEAIITAAKYALIVKEAHPCTQG